MTKEELQILLTELLPTATFEEGGEWLNVIIDPLNWFAFATSLRTDAALYFDYLFCLTCVDFKTHFTMVYHLESTVHRHIIVVKAKLERATPAIETASGIWKTADFHEREVYELFGVDFIHHPDLRLLILPDGWEGKNPLRKDYEDAVNMIKL